MTEQFDGDWLALREPADHAARSRHLAEILSDRLPARPRLLDLGAGTGSLFRWLAPIIGRSQAWVFADADPELLARAMDDTADWAEDQGWAVSSPARALLVHAPGGTWRIETRRVDLSNPRAELGLAMVDAVTCSALLDLVSADWVEGFVGRLTTPLLACLSVDGRDRFLPAHPLDGTIRGLFRRDQQRDKGFGPALGTRAPQVLQQALAGRGFESIGAASDWRIEPSGFEMLTELIGSHAEVAGSWDRGLRAAIADWEDVRLDQARRGRLRIHIGHRDCLAFPPTHT